MDTIMFSVMSVCLSVYSQGAANVIGHMGSPIIWTFGTPAPLPFHIDTRDRLYKLIYLGVWPSAETASCIAEMFGK